MMWTCVHIGLTCLKECEKQIFIPVRHLFSNAEWRLRKGQNKTFLFSPTEIWHRRENCSFPCSCVSENGIQTPFRSLFTLEMSFWTHPFIGLLSLSGHEYSHNPLAPVPAPSFFEGVCGGFLFLRDSSSIPFLKGALAWSPHEMISLSLPLSRASKPPGPGRQKAGESP